MTQENLYIKFGKKKYIQLENGFLTVTLSSDESITDRLENFNLEYHEVYYGCIGFMLMNKKKGFITEVIDFIAGKKKIAAFDELKEQMERLGLYAGRSRFQVWYKPTPDEERLEQKRRESKRRKSVPKDKKSNLGSYDRRRFTG
jgi:hypothetical protein